MIAAALLAVTALAPQSDNPWERRIAGVVSAVQTCISATGVERVDVDALVKAGWTPAPIPEPLVKQGKMLGYFTKSGEETRMSVARADESEGCVVEMSGLRPSEISNIAFDLRRELKEPVSEGPASLVWRTAKHLVVLDRFQKAVRAYVINRPKETL